MVHITSLDSNHIWGLILSRVVRNKMDLPKLKKTLKLVVHQEAEASCPLFIHSNSQSAVSSISSTQNSNQMSTTSMTVFSNLYASNPLLDLRKHFKINCSEIKETTEELELTKRKKVLVHWHSTFSLYTATPTCCIASISRTQEMLEEMQGTRL